MFNALSIKMFALKSYKWILEIHMYFLEHFKFNKTAFIHLHKMMWCFRRNIFVLQLIEQKYC